jgi:hypothetical protein
MFATFPELGNVASLRYITGFLAVLLPISLKNNTPTPHFLLAFLLLFAYITWIYPGVTSVAKLTRSDAVHILNKEYDARVTYPILSNWKAKGKGPTYPLTEEKVRELGEQLKAEREKRGR